MARAKTTGGTAVIGTIVAAMMGAGCNPELIYSGGEIDIKLSPLDGGPEVELTFQTDGEEGIRWGGTRHEDRGWLQVSTSLRTPLELDCQAPIDLVRLGSEVVRNSNRTGVLDYLWLEFHSFDLWSVSTDLGPSFRVGGTPLDEGLIDYSLDLSSKGVGHIHVIDALTSGESPYSCLGVEAEEELPYELTLEWDFGPSPSRIVHETSSYMPAGY